MIFSRLSHRLFTVAVSGSILLWSVSSQAANFTYHVDLNVTTLLTAPTSGPYSLDFQLNGDGLPAAGTNAVTLSNFTFNVGGGAMGTATTYEGASGSFASGVTLSLTSTNNLNELYQGFTATTTDIQFDVSTTQNGSGITPDTFLVEVLNNSLNPITTNALDTGSLLSQPINGPVTLGSVSTYTSTSPMGVTATVSTVPEPSTWAVMLLGLGVLVRVGLLRRPARA